MAIHPGRPSAPTLLAVGRRIVDIRDDLVESWFEAILERQSGTLAIEPIELRRTLCLIVSLLGHMTGPMRREARDPWHSATELYGRLAEARGLSAGEVVDELHQLRELLVIELGDIILALPARQQLPTVLRVDRVCDAAVSSAVVGYTDALVAKMFTRDGVPVAAADTLQEIVASMHSLERDLAFLNEHSAG